ncbi:hypothetical protein AAF712_015670 [Marasmius tenuissimus]|uniref:CCHC-type domain-containing protein n=1 Tax=Marasmius tenuissimus TaxID=585030 RepID=A0ABR2ZA62_9AGAR
MKRDAAEVPVPREVRQGTLRTPGKSEPATKTELDDDTMKVLAKVDTYDTKLKTFQSDMEQFQTRVIENLQKSEKTLDNNLVELRKLISATRETPKASYSRTTCFMCGKTGHMAPECDYQEECIKKGWIRKGDGGKYVLYDGSPVPFVRFGENKQRWEIIKEKAEANHWPNTSGGEDPTAVLFATEQEPGRESFMQKTAPEIADHSLIKEMAGRLGSMEDVMESYLNMESKDESKN